MHPNRHASRDNDLEGTILGDVADGTHFYAGFSVLAKAQMPTEEHQNAHAAVPAHPALHPPVPRRHQRRRRRCCRRSDSPVSHPMVLTLQPERLSVIGRKQQPDKVLKQELLQARNGGLELHVTSPDALELGVFLHQPCEELLENRPMPILLQKSTDEGVDLKTEMGSEAVVVGKMMVGEMARSEALQLLYSRIDQIGHLRLPRHSGAEAHVVLGGHMPPQTTEIYTYTYCQMGCGMCALSLV